MCSKQVCQRQVGAIFLPSMKTGFYHAREWKSFRAEVIELDGGKCRRCGRKASQEVVLQVHHLRYQKDRKPWQYAYSDCETLCKGCHAQLHGKVMPRFGWDYVGEDDLGDLSGNCELCGNEIRYQFHIQHPNWEPLAVGTVCCDHLTGTNHASNFMESFKRFQSRRERFVESSRWQQERGIQSIRQKGLVLQISESKGGFQILLNQRKGAKRFPSLRAAKEFAFEVIEDGKAENYLKKVGAV